MINIPFLKKSSDNNFIGIDIGTHSLKMVELSGGKDVVLENYAELFMHDFIGSAPIKGSGGSFLYSTKEIAEALKYLLKESGSKTKKAYFSLPDFVSFFTSFSVPAADKEEVSSSIGLHARQYIPLPISEVALDWFLEDGKDPQNKRVNLVAVPNEVIDQYREIASLAGVEISSLEGEMFSLIRAFARDIVEPVAIFDMGEQSTLLTIAEKGSLKTTHSLEMAGNMIIKQVAKFAQIEYNEAREIIAAHGMKEDVIKRAISSPLTSLFHEVSRVIDIFEKKESKVVNEIIITGGFSLIPGIVDYASDVVDKKIITKNCFDSVKYPEILKEEIKTISNSHSIALGSALSGTEEDND